jgi:integrase
MPTPPPAKTWTHEEYLTMIEYTRTRESKHVHRWLFILGYRTGMSMVDACHLRWPSVHLNENGPSFIEYYRTKQARTGRAAFCQIPIVAGSDLHQELLKRKAVAHLNYHRFDGIDDYVHQDCPGIYHGGVYRAANDFNDIWWSAGIDRQGRSYKTFRSTFVSNLVNSGVQYALICKMTGHQNLKTLMLYLKVDRLALQDQLNVAYEYGARNDNRPITAFAAPRPVATATPAPEVPAQTTGTEAA